MALSLKNKKNVTKEVNNGQYVKSFMDMISPSVYKFNFDYYILGNTYRRVLAIRNYTLTTKSTALLSKIASKSNVTLKIFFSQMSSNEYQNNIQSSVNKNTSEAKEYKLINRVEAKKNITITEKLVEFVHGNPEERMFNVSVYIELIGNTKDEMETLTSDVNYLLEGITHDKLFLKQKEGFLSVNPIGLDKFNSQFERHMPSSSAANLYPFSYNEKIEKEGFPLGKESSGGQLIIDFDKRDSTHTNSNILILGDSGQGKTYLLNGIKTDQRLKGNKILSLDAEGTGVDMTRNLSGTYIDVLSGGRMINFLEPKLLSSSDSVDADINDLDYVDAFSQKTILSQHISSLRDFFRIYKNLNDLHLDVIEIMLEKTYKKFKIDFETDLSGRTSMDFPIAIDLYNTVEEEFQNYDKLKYPIYSKEMLQNILLNLYSICKGPDSRFFNGHTNIESYDYITFGVKSLLETSDNLKDAMFFNILCYMYSKLLVEGNTYADLDELYLFLENIRLVKYIRNFVKRVRKKDSAMILASQNIEDYLRADIAELTKPMFAIPTYKFLFHPGDIDSKIYKNLLSVTDSEYKLIKSPMRGNCLFKSGNERFNLQVKFPKWKEDIWGSSGGR